MGVYRRGKTWWIDYYFEGERRRESIGSQRKLAETVLGKRLVEIAEGKFLDVKRAPTVSFHTVADEYVKWARTNKRSWKNDASCVKRLKDFFGDRQLSGISPLLIEGYKRTRLEAFSARYRGRRISKRGVDLDLACLKHMLALAVDWGYLQSNPASKVKLFRSDVARLRYLSEEEIASFLGACEAYFRPVALTAIFTGMRMSEILGLKWANVDLSNGILHVERTKTGLRRDVPTCETVRAALGELRTSSRCEWVFVQERDPSSRLRDVRKPFKRARVKAGIVDFRFHDMRHTAASHLIMKGVDLRTVADILGHRDIKMTMRYAHLSPTHRAAAVRALDDLGHKMVTNGVSEDGNNDRFFGGNVSKNNNLRP